MMVKIEHLDRLLGLVGEVIITSNSIATTNRRIQENYDRRIPIDKVSMDMIKIAEESSNRISSDMHSLVMDIRMVEMRGTFQRFRRPVRDMAKEAGKQVELELIGEDTLVDKTISEKLYDPLNHQIRNAMDHGIEDPLERQRSGKPPVGSLRLKAYQRENNIFVEIRDDGRGINADSVVSAAIERGIITQAEADGLSEDEKLKLIYHPGLSTKSTASKISGRGVGMDVVKMNIEELGGEVTIETELGKGTTFTFLIPQVTAVNILDCLTVRAGSNLFAIPILNVVSTMRIPSDQVHVAFGKGKSITYLGAIITLYDLNELLDDSPLADRDALTVVIVESKTGRIALSVSELLTPEKLVYTPLADMFEVQGISGVTMMSGNKMGLIVDVQELVNRSRGIGKNMDDTAGTPASSIIAGMTGKETTPTGEDAAPGKELDEGVGAGEMFSTDGAVTLSSDIGAEISHREEFLAELGDMVNNAGEKILNLEQVPGDIDLVNTIFRDFHSIKGNLMMVGLTELGAFIHEVEAILDRARSGSLEINSEIIDILLDSTDVIKSAQRDLAKGKAPKIDAAHLKNIEKYQKPKEEKKRDVVDIHQRTFHLSSLEQFNLLAHRHSGYHVYQLFLTFEPKYQHPFLVALLILKRISQIGYIFGAVPMVEEIEKQDIDNQLKIMFSSNLDADKLNGYMEDVLMKYYDVTEFEVLKTV